MPDIIQNLTYNYSGNNTLYSMLYNIKANILIELCPELQDIVLITSNINQFPFPKKVIEPEVPREVEFPRMEEVLVSSISYIILELSFKIINLSI